LQVKQQHFNQFGGDKGQQIMVNQNTPASFIQHLAKSLDALQGAMYESGANSLWVGAELYDAMEECGFPQDLADGSNEYVLENAQTLGMLSEVYTALATVYTRNTNFACLAS
jgi:hypothetical protein